VSAMTSERPREPELDDWFDEPDTTDVWSSRIDRRTREQQAQRAAVTDADDWLGDQTRAPGRSFSRRLSRRALLASAGLLVVVVLGALAAAGVFSGSGHPGTQGSAPPTRSTPTTTVPVTQQPRAVALPTAPLKPGDHGAAVTKLQRALAQAGDSPGSVDGIYGSSTTRAVERFQRAHGLTADGIAGSKTLAALRQALRSG
jgi:Putative peptidoglycan binding domain